MPSQAPRAISDNEDVADAKVTVLGLHDTATLRERNNLFIYHNGGQLTFIADRFRWFALEY